MKQVTSNYNSILLKYQFGRQSQLIYLTILTFIVTAIISTYFLKTTISIKSQGLLQSFTEKADLNIPVNGIVKQINLKDNASIVANDTLLVIDANLPEQENILVVERVLKLQQNLGDIKKLLSAANEVYTINLQTSQYALCTRNYQLSKRI